MLLGPRQQAVAADLSHEQRPRVHRWVGVGSFSGPLGPELDPAVREQSPKRIEVGFAVVDPYLRRHGWIATRSRPIEHLQARVQATHRNRGGPGIAFFHMPIPELL